MKYLQGTIKYNEHAQGYGIMGDDGWIREKLLPDDDIAVWLESGWFHSRIKGSEHHTYLQPNSFDGWKQLEGVPAAYIDYERPPNQPKPTEAEIKKAALKSGILAILFSVCCAAVLGALFALLFHKDQDFGDSFIRSSKMMYIMFCAGMSVGGLLMVTRALPVDLCIGFGCAIYYGTFLLSAFLSNFIFCPTVNRLIIAFVIVALISYIIWLTQFKHKYTETNST